jgi:hypothetical protein
MLGGKAREIAGSKTGNIASVGTGLVLVQGGLSWFLIASCHNICSEVSK